jgi:hypothetical protein
VQKERHPTVWLQALRPLAYYRHLTEHRRAARACQPVRRLSRASEREPSLVRSKALVPERVPVRALRRVRALRQVWIPRRMQT